MKVALSCSNKIYKYDSNLIFFQIKNQFIIVFLTIRIDLKMPPILHFKQKITPQKRPLNKFGDTPKTYFSGALITVCKNHCNSKRYILNIQLVYNL